PSTIDLRLYCTVTLKLRYLAPLIDSPRGTQPSSMRWFGGSYAWPPPQKPELPLAGNHSVSAPPTWPIEVLLVVRVHSMAKCHILLSNEWPRWALPGALFR